jgi:hypothetical protein
MQQEVVAQYKTAREQVEVQLPGKIQKLKKQIINC